MMAELYGTQYHGAFSAVPLSVLHRFELNVILARVLTGRLDLVFRKRTTFYSGSRTGTINLPG